MNVDSIKNGTFYGCSSLRVVVIVGVTSIGVSAFEGCSSLAAFHCYNKTPPTIESYKRPSFPKYGKETTLYVPERCLIKL